MPDWAWKVRCYFADGVAPPKRPGELAIETVHASDSSRAFEVAAALSRADIGKIVIIDLADGTRYELS